MIKYFSEFCINLYKWLRPSNSKGLAHCAVEQPVARVELVMGTLSCHDHTSHTLICTLEFSNLNINVHHIHNIQRKLILVPFP